MKTTQKLAAVCAAAAIAFTAGPGRAGDPGFAGGIVASDGSIRVPENFRTDFVMLGAWSVAGDADTGGEIGLHVVYAPTSAVDGYRRTGAFPDGVVLVKELFTTRTESLTTGEATRGDANAGHFVMIKDEKGRFPGNPRWGDGWGWSFFEAGDPSRAVTEDYEAECLACHEPARSTDLVYIQAYPVLKK